MKTRVDARLRDEARRFGLVFTCEHCAHFASDTGECAHEYPNHAHRSGALEERTELEFCKEFELY